MFNNFDEMSSGNMTTANVAKIAADLTVPSCVRDVYLELQKTSYLTVGEYLERISDDDLEDLVQMADTIFLGEKKGVPQAVQDEAYSNIILFALGLALGEGIIGLTDEEIEHSCKIASMYITLESLYRRGEIYLHHENMSMGDDSKHKVVAVRRDN